MPFMSQPHSIIYTWTDEAPALASRSFLPVIRAFAAAADVPVETCDISLAGRILAVFPERLTSEQQMADGLGELGLEIGGQDKADVAGVGPLRSLSELSCESVEGCSVCQLALQLAGQVGIGQVDASQAEPAGHGAPRSGAVPPPSANGAGAQQQPHYSGG